VGARGTDLVADNLAPGGGGGHHVLDARATLGGRLLTLRNVYGVCTGVQPGQLDFFWTRFLFYHFLFEIKYRPGIRVLGSYFSHHPAAGNRARRQWSEATKYERATEGRE